MSYTLSLFMAQKPTKLWKQLSRIIFSLPWKQQFLNSSLFVTSCCFMRPIIILLYLISLVSQSTYKNI